MIESCEEYLFLKFFVMGIGILFAACFIGREIKELIIRWISKHAGHF